jgi:hypothetical protein
MDFSTPASNLGSLSFMSWARDLANLAEAFNDNPLGKFRDSTSNYDKLLPSLRFQILTKVLSVSLKLHK